MQFIRPKDTSLLDFSEQRFYDALHFGSLVGGPIHFIIAFFFYFSEVYILSTLNFFGGFLYFFLFYLIQKFQFKTAFWIALIEIVIICFLDTYYIGWNAGFHYYILIFLPIFFLYNKWRKVEILFASMLIFIGYLGCFVVNKYYTPYYTIGPEFSYYISLGNFVGAFFTFLGVILYFNKSISKIEKQLILSNQDLIKKNEDKKILLKEIHHRVKNNLHVVNSILEVQAMEIQDKKLRAYMRDAQRRIISMASIHEKMYGSDNLKYLSAADYLKSLVLDLQRIYDKEKKVRLELEFHEVELDLDTIAPLAFLVNEVITNSYKHAFENVDSPKIFGSLKLYDDKVALKLGDNGGGFDEEILGSESSLGSDLIDSFVNELNATYDRLISNGTVYSFVFDKKVILPEIKEK